jgi:hypothetical protein
VAVARLRLVDPPCDRGGDELHVSAGTLVSFRMMCTTFPPGSTKLCPALKVIGMQFIVFM